MLYSRNVADCQFSDQLQVQVLARRTSKFSQFMRKRARSIWITSLGQIAKLETIHYHLLNSYGWLSYLVPEFPRSMESRVCLL